MPAGNDWNDIARRPDIGMGDVHVLLIRISREQGRARELRSVLSDDEIKRAEKFIFEKDRLKYVFSQGCLRQFLGRYAGIDPKEVWFSSKKRGKPVLANDCRPLSFNISHSGDCVIFAFSENRELGIDIEQIRVMGNQDTIVERFFSDREIDEYKRLPVSMKNRAFFTCWTRKEAFIKALGEGLYMPLDHFYLSPDPAKKPVVEFGDECAKTDWRMEDIDTGDPSYASAIAVQGADCRLSFWR